MQGENRIPQIGSLKATTVIGKRRFQMKKMILIVLTSVLALGIVANLSGSVTETAGLPAPNGKALWTYMTEDDPYLGWGFWPGHIGMYPGKSPHGAHLKLYANSIALKAAREGKPMPYGSILVKENYGKDQKTLVAVTPMYKVKGFNPDGGDWFWAKYGPEGKIMKAGKVEGCINCHRVRRDQGWIFTETK
jgi:hypothetical protein